jgi:hypothetical protein
MRENPLGGRAVMPIQRYKPEQIVTMLRQIESGKYGGLKMDQADAVPTSDTDERAAAEGSSLQFRTPPQQFGTRHSPLWAKLIIAASPMQEIHACNQ